MIENVFDPAGQTAPISVRADPGRITVGNTNFLDPRSVYGLELSPIQAALLVLALTEAIAKELEYAESYNELCRGPRSGGFEGFQE